MGEYELRITRAAAEELGLSGESGRDLTDDADHQHLLLRAFVRQRAQDPQGQETVRLPCTRNQVFSLHAGRWRGGTWHDREAGVVWLLGGGWHEEGDRDDAYAVLMARDRSGTLFPTEDDYLDLEPSTEDIQRAFAKSLIDDPPRIVARLLAQPGTEIVHRFGGVIDVALTIADAGDLGERIWFGFRLPPLMSQIFSNTYYEGIIAAFVPYESAGLRDVEWHEAFPRDAPLPPDVETELVYSAPFDRPNASGDGS